MAVNTNKLKLKFNDECLPRLFSTQADTNREFIINITDEDDNQVDITGMSLDFFVGNDKQVTKVAGTIKDGKNGIFIVKAVNSQFKYPGLNKAQFILSDGNGGKIGSQLIDLWVEESIENGATVGQNVIVDFETIKTAVDLIKNYEKTFEESKMINVDLKESISTGVNLNTELKTSTSKANSAKNSLDGSINKANSVKSGLDSSVSKGINTKTTLDNSINSGKETNTNLNSSITEAGKIKTDLDSSIKLGKETDANLKTTTQEAKNTNTSVIDSKQKLDSSISAANTSKTNLDSSISKANSGKTKLDTSTESAKNVKTELDGSIASATAKNTELKGTTTTATTTDTEAKKTIETLQALLTKSEGSEKSLKEIIASGNLDKYVTDPKLVEVLKDYATKTELDNIDVTSKLGDYALKKEIKTKLSEMTEDETHRTVTDAEKTTWNGKAEKTDIPKKLSELENDETFKTETEIKALIKTEAPKQDLSGYALKTDLNTLVSKVDGKGLSTNDYTNTAKAKVDAIPTNPKYTDTTYDLSPYAKKTELMTESHVNSLIAKSTKLKKEVVTSLPSTGKDDVLYLKKDGNDINNSYVEYMWINGAWEIIGNTKIDLNPYAKKTDIKTKLSELTDDNTHRTVTDTEKTTWNSKLSTVSGQDVSRSKTKGYSSASSWTSVGNSRDVEDWIGDFDKRTRENRTKVDSVQSMTTAEVEAVLNEVFG